MRRLAILLLTAALLLSPALAAGETEELFPAVREPIAFTDVAQDAWYADAVALCYEAGLLNGTGDDQFSPDKPVTLPETYTLAARIHSILNGGDGTLPAAPEDWGQLTVTRADGVTAVCQKGSDGWGVHGKTERLQFRVDESWADFDGQTVTITLEQTSCTGTISCSQPKDGGVTATFDPDYSEGTTEFYELLYFYLYKVPGPGSWYRDTAWYSYTVLGAEGWIDQHACRLDFVTILGLISDGLLESINEVDAIPDCDADQTAAVLPFYEAGILSGMDEYGTFQPYKQLSRAEMAAMAARLIRPDLRLTFTLATQENEG